MCIQDFWVISKNPSKQDITNVFVDHMKCIISKEVYCARKYKYPSFWSLLFYVETTRKTLKYLDLKA